MATNQSFKSYIVLIDGNCVLCDAFSQFVLSRDDKSRFYFGTQQSTFGQNLLTTNGIPNDLKTIILISKSSNQTYTKSEAILRILTELNFPWSLSSLCLYIPAFLRDFIYDKISINRYFLFGKKEDVCILPSQEIKNKILAD